MMSLSVHAEKITTTLLASAYNETQFEDGDPTIPVPSLGRVVDISDKCPVEMSPAP
jgi:hypothetical protein